MAALRVVTLPPGCTGEAATAFAQRARRRGAHLLEVRNDLHDDDTDLAPLAALIDLLVSERGRPLSPRWLGAARFADVERGGALPHGVEAVFSHHALTPLLAEDAAAAWSAAGIPEGAQIKHVEPLGAPASFERLLRLQRMLADRFGASRVTVLAMDACALPFRCVLAQRNALDYLALEPGFVAAPGQRLLDDAVREAVRCGPSASPRARLGIFGSNISHSRSPRIHPQPFDRIDLPPDADVGLVFDALRPHYRGFAITSPFKRTFARHIGAEVDAINTLYFKDGVWRGANTDVEGARAALQLLPAGKVTILGDGGVAPALREAAALTGRSLEVVRRSQADALRLSGAVVWTWPATVQAPVSLRLDGARVAVIAYGAASHLIARQISTAGGTPVRVGARWFIAQARAQRALWYDPGHP